MNKEEILVSAEVKTFLHDLYSQIEYELQEQYKDEVQKLTQENKDLEERVIHQDNLIKQLEEWIKEQIEFIYNIPAFTKEIKLSDTQQIATYQYVLDKLNELRGKNKL